MHVKKIIIIIVIAFIVFTASLYTGCQLERKRSGAIYNERIRELENRILQDQNTLTEQRDAILETRNRISELEQINTAIQDTYEQLEQLSGARRNNLENTREAIERIESILSNVDTRARNSEKTAK